MDELQVIQEQLLPLQPSENSAVWLIGQENSFCKK